MKAIVYTRYGPPEVLQLQQVEKPTPKDHEVLIRVYATTVTTGDLRMRRADPFLIRFINGLWRPRRKILGVELAGVVEGVGQEVRNFREGDEVFGGTGLRMGAYAEYLCLPEKGSLTRKPGNISFEEAAAIPFGGNTALYYLRDKGRLPEGPAGQKVLIYGASGCVGTYAVQLAKYYGAEVTGVCSSANLELVRSIGADAVIDYTKEDFAATGIRYDCIFDAVGKTSKAACRKILAPGATYLTVNKGLARARSENLEFLANLVARGEIKVVIDRRYPLDDTAAAHGYAEKGRKKGNVVIIVRDPE